MNIFCSFVKNRIEMENLRRYPIGIQTFSEIRKSNYLCIDKTEYVYWMVHFTKYVFLSRPRRFGKSLLTSTLHSYFSGQKELFQGLAIEKLEKEWTEYPVLHFDMSTAKHADCEQLLQELNMKLIRYEEVYGKMEGEINPNQRLEGLIKRAYEQTGKQVVVLIDEYDAPLLDVVHEEERLGVLRNIMRNFYSPLKACDPYLRYVFLTGITKFSQLSIFSELNNIKNISMNESYAAICGITENEILVQMKDDVDALAQKLEVTSEEVLAKLKENYDGYHFTYPSPDIYNPFSLLNAFADGKFNSYWFGSGTPTYLIKMLDKFGVAPSRHRSWEIPFRLCHANRLHNYCRTDRDRICLHDERLQTQKRQRMSQLPSLRTRRQCRVLQILRTSSESVRNRRGKEINFTTYAERNARIKQ